MWHRCTPTISTSGFNTFQRRYGKSFEDFFTGSQTLAVIPTMSDKGNGKEKSLGSGESGTNTRCCSKYVRKTPVYHQKRPTEHPTVRLSIPLNGVDTVRLQSVGCTNYSTSIHPDALTFNKYTLLDRCTQRKIQL